MVNRLFWAAVLVCLPFTAWTEPATSDEPQSMRFEWVREAADRCVGECRRWVTATGPITKDSIKDFDLLSQVKELKGVTLVLDSGGGSVLTSLELGRRVRAVGMNATVGRVIKSPTAPGEEQRGRLSPRGECASMCAFVLLGGVKRVVPPEARILVHQIWPGTKRNDASAETYTAEELVRVQRDVGRIARYTVEMGGDIELFELAMRIPPWERLRALSAPELRRVGLQTIETAELRTSGAVVGKRVPMPDLSLTPPRGWVVAQEGERQELLRRHPLTVEGEEIGSFELSVGCSDGGSLRLDYFEARSLSDAGTARVQDVSVRLGTYRVALAVSSSVPEQEGDALASVAQGTIEPSVLESMAKDPDSVLLVTTRTSDNLRTSIRVGGAGLEAAYRRFASYCRTTELH